MCRIQINTKCRQYKKEDKMTQRSICSSLNRLSERIISECGNVNKIYNNDSIVYDRINDQIFIYKSHGINNIQLRIVYGYENTSDGPIIYLIDYTVKKKNDKKYIVDMNCKFKSSRLSDMMFSELHV